MKKSFDRNKKSHSEKSFGNRQSFSKPNPTNGRFRAVCGQCGSACEVPFKPSSQRPVLCNNCFRKDDDSAPIFSDRPKRFGSERTNSTSHIQDPTQKQLAIINSKLDKILSILEDLEIESD